MTDLSGKRAFITGASSGLGRHFAALLASAGAEVVVAARRGDALRTLVDELTARGLSASAVSLDVTDGGSVREALTSTGPLDILINNAGVTNTKPLLDQSEEDLDKILSTNLKGSFLVATHFARGLRDAGRSGSIVNIASILGVRQGGQLTPYAVSKAAVIQMTKQMALELARHDIRVNALAPGYIATELNDDFFETEAGKALVRRIPQRRLGQMSDLDGPLLLLASDASRYMTGSVLVVDGGHLTSSL